MRRALIVLVALALPLVPFLVVGELPGERWLSTRDDNAFGFAVTGMSLLVADVLLPIPSSAIIGLLVARLDVAVGATTAWTGLVLGSGIGYGVGRLWPQRFAATLPEAPTLWLLFLSRPVPVLAEAVAVAAGATRVRLSSMLAASAAGNAVYAAAMATGSAALVGGGSGGDWWLLVLLALPIPGWFIWHRVRAANKSVATRVQRNQERA